jgi:hypothetical protein
MEVRSCVYRLATKHELHTSARGTGKYALCQSYLIYLHQTEVIQPHLLTVKQILGPSGWGPQSRDACGVNIENYTTRMNTNLSPISNCLTSRATVGVRGEIVLVLPKQTCTICTALYFYNCLKKSASVAMPSGSGRACSLRSFDFGVCSVTGHQSFLKKGSIRTSQINKLHV